MSAQKGEIDAIQHGHIKRELYYQCNIGKRQSCQLTDVRISSEGRSKRLSTGAEREEEEHDENYAEYREDDHSHHQIHAQIRPAGIEIAAWSNLTGLIEHVSQRPPDINRVNLQQQQRKTKWTREKSEKEKEA